LNLIAKKLQTILRRKGDFLGELSRFARSDVFSSLMYVTDNRVRTQYYI